MQEWLFLIKPNICLFFRNLHLGNKSFISDHFDIAVDTCTSTVFIDEKKAVLEIMKKTEEDAERRHQEKMTVLRGFLDLMTNITKKD